jgi:hypothetical protein
MNSREHVRVSGSNAYRTGVGNPFKPVIIEDGPATPKQIRYLVSFGVPEASTNVLIKVQASKLIELLEQHETQDELNG